MINCLYFFLLIRGLLNTKKEENPKYSGEPSYRGMYGKLYEKKSEEKKKRLRKYENHRYLKTSDASIHNASTPL